MLLWHVLNNAFNHFVVFSGEWECSHRCSQKASGQYLFIYFLLFVFLDRLQLLSQPISQLEENINKLDKENETHDKVGSPGKPID